MSECDCPLHGYCQRHGIHKPEAWHKLCKTREDYRLAWNEGHGPGQMPGGAPQRSLKTPFWVSLVKKFKSDSDRGVGDTFQRLAASVGGERWKSLMNKAGRGCGCGDRQSKWNRLWPYEKNESHG
jgi:hypothetical protein